MIVKANPKIEDVAVRGVTTNASEAKITITAVPDKAGIAARIFTEISQKDVNVDIIVQNVSQSGLTDISFTVPRKELTKALAASQAIAKKINAGQVSSDKTVARVSIVGSGMRSHRGIAAKMFETLAKLKINIDMISTSEISVSCIIEEKHAKKATEALHTVFGLGNTK